MRGLQVQADISMTELTPLWNATMNTEDGSQTDSKTETLVVKGT